MKTQNIKKGINLGIYLTIATVTLGLMLVAPSLNNKIFAASLEPSMNKLTTFNIGAGSKKDVRANGYYEEQNRLNELYKLFSVNQKLTDAQYRNYKYQDITENKQKGNIYDQITAPYDIFPKFKEPGKLHDPIGKRTLKFAVTDGYSLQDYYLNPSIFCIDRRRIIHDGTPDNRRGLSKNPLRTGKSLDQEQMEIHIKSYIDKLRRVPKGDQLIDFTLTEEDKKVIVDRIMLIMMGADNNAEYGDNIEDITHLNGGSANVGESVPYNQITLGEFTSQKQIAGGRYGAIAKGAARTGSTIEYDIETFEAYIGGAISSLVSEKLNETHSGEYEVPKVDNIKDAPDSGFLDEYPNVSGNTAVKTGLKALLKSQNHFKEDEAYLAYLISDYEQRGYGKLEAINNYDIRYTHPKVGRQEPMQFVVWDSPVSYHRAGESQKSPGNVQAMELIAAAKDFQEYIKKLKNFKAEEENSGYQRLLYSKIYHRHIMIERQSRKHDLKGQGEEESVIIKNPQIKYEPRILPGKDYTMEEASFVKFDTETQKWILGPYKLDYLSHKYKDKYLAGLRNIKLYGKYTNDNGDITPDANKPVENGRQFIPKNDKKPTIDINYENNENPLKKIKKIWDISGFIENPVDDNIYNSIGDQLNEDTFQDIERFTERFKVDLYNGGTLELNRGGEAIQSLATMTETADYRTRTALLKIYRRLEKSFVKWNTLNYHRTYEIVGRGLLDEEDVKNIIEAYIIDNKYLTHIEKNEFSVRKEEVIYKEKTYDKWIIEKHSNDLENKLLKKERVHNEIYRIGNIIDFRNTSIFDRFIQGKEEADIDTIVYSNINGGQINIPIHKTYSRLNLNVSELEYESKVNEIKLRTSENISKRYIELINYIKNNQKIEPTSENAELINIANKELRDIEISYVKEILIKLDNYIGISTTNPEQQYYHGYKNIDIIRNGDFSKTGSEYVQLLYYLLGIQTFKIMSESIWEYRHSDNTFTTYKGEEEILLLGTNGSNIFLPIKLETGYIGSGDKKRNNTYFYGFGNVYKLIKPNSQYVTKWDMKSTFFTYGIENRYKMTLSETKHIYGKVKAEVRALEALKTRYPELRANLTLNGKKTPIKNRVNITGVTYSKEWETAFPDTWQTMETDVATFMFKNALDKDFGVALQDLPEFEVEKRGNNEFVIRLKPGTNPSNPEQPNPNNPQSPTNPELPQLTPEEEAKKKQAQEEAIWAIDRQDQSDNTGYVTEDELIAYENDKDKFNIAEEYNREGFTEVKKWQLLTENEKAPGEILEPNEEFYFVIDYDPALASIARAKFEFTYMIFGGSKRVYQTYAGHFSGIKLKVESEIEAEDVDITQNAYDSNGNVYPISVPATDVKPDFIVRFSGMIDGEMDQQQTNMHVEAMRWYEDIALELRFTDKNSYGLLLRTPIGGKVWEDRQGVKRKHVGYNNLLDINNNEHPDKMVSGIKVTIFRNFVKFGANKSVEEIISREFARLYKVDTDEQIKPEEAQRIFTNDKGEYGPYDIHDIGFTQDELKNYNTKDYGVVFDVRFDYDGMYYEPVTPMQLPDAEVYKEAKQSVEAVENFNKMSSADKKLFARSSFAFENIKERDRFNSVNASIAGERPITQDKKTVGKTLTIESGNVEGRVNTPRLIEYEKGNDVGTSKRVERVESKYVKEVPKEALIGKKKVNSFDEYANKFVSASTINIGIKLPANEKIVFKTEKDQSIPEKIAKFQGIYYSSKAYMKNINLGLRRRKPVQLAVIKSINNAVVTVNKKAYNYVYNDLHLEMRSEREKAEGLGTMIDLPKYQNTVENNQIDRILELYKTDYIYRTAMYSGNKELAEVMKRQINELDKKDGNDADREDTRQLDVFVTYRVNVFNHSPVDTVMLNAIDDYYNNKMELVNKSIKKYIENDPKSNITQEGLNVDIHGDAKNELEIAKGRYVVFDKNDKSKKPKPYIGKIDGRNVFEIEDKKWDKQQERLYKQKVQLPSYLDMSRIEGKDKNMILKPDESMDIYLTFRVKNAKDIQTVASTDGESLGTLNGNTGIKTLTNALNLGDFENVVEIARFTTYDTLTGKASAKFDEFSAPDNVDLNGLKEGRKVKFESDTYSAPLITLQIPKETNDIKTNRTITGLLWEDKRNKENRGILTGDGTFEAGEAPIPDTPITLEERISISRKLLNGSNSNTSGFFSNGNGLKYTTENFDDGSKFIDIPFIWPNHIKGKGIEIDLKTVTGFESTVVTDINGNYTFTGVPSGNMIVSMDYTSPNKKIKAFIYDNANREAKSIEHIIEETEAIHVNDLIKTANSVDRDVKYYNGMDFKNTMFNVTHPESLNQTWIDKKDRDYNVSLLRDDEYRRLKVAKNFEIINNANSKYVDIFRGKIDTFNNDRELDEAVGMAHKLSTMRATTPKMNFSVEFYENSENLDFNNLHVSKIAEYDNLYNIIGDTENNIRDKNYKIENINLGIVERPNTKLVLNKEITGISVVTSNGEKPIDINFNIKAKVNKATKNTNVEYGNSGETESTIEFAREVDMASSTGLDYVLSLDRTQKLDGILESAKPGRSERELKNELLKGGFRYINIDKNIMQDAGISIRYGIFAYNLGEIDRKIDLERAISDKIIEPVNISDYDIEINRRTAKENAYRIGPNANQGKLNIEATTNDNFGKYVGLEYYVLTGNNKLTEEEISKISVTEVMDLTDTSTEVNVDDLYNKSWSRADKKDLIGKVQNIERSEAELINNNGEKYIQELDNSNNIDSSVYLTKTARLEMIPFKAIDNDIEQYKLMYNGKEGYLTDEENREHKFGVRWNIKTDKTISSQSDRKELAFDNIAEVVGYHSGTGRRDPKSTPGNVNVLIDKNSGHGGGIVPGKDVTGINIPHDNTSWMKPITNNSNGPDEIISKATGREHDASSAESVTLSPPTGLGIETKATNTAIIVTTVFILGAITIVVLQSKKQ